MIDGLQAHPSIVVWVVFNEGWGQFDTQASRRLDQAVRPDPTGRRRQRLGRPRGRGRPPRPPRLPPPQAPPLEASRAGVLGEFGGLSLGVDGHTWTNQIWGYAGTASTAELTRKYERLLREGWDMKDAEGAQRPGLHPDHRRRDRGQRPPDLRPGRHQGRPRPGRRREPGRRLPDPRRKDHRADLARNRPGLAILDRQAGSGHWTAPTSTTRPGRKAPESSGPPTPPAPTSGRPGTPPTSGPEGPSTSPKSTPPPLPLRPPRRGRRDLPQRGPRRNRQGPHRELRRTPQSPPKPEPPSSPART